MLYLLGRLAQSASVGCSQCTAIAGVTHLVCKLVIDWKYRSVHCENGAVRAIQGWELCKQSRHCIGSDEQNWQKSVGKIRY